VQDSIPAVVLTFAKRRAEAIGAIGTITIATLYALGFGVTLLHYSQFGITSLSLLRAQYVLVGFYLVLPAAAFWAFMNLWVFLMSLYEIYFAKKVHYRRWVKAALWMLGAVAVVLCWHFFRPFRQGRLMAWLDTLSDFTSLWVFGMFCFVALRFTPRPEKESPFRPVFMSGRTLLVTILMICLFRYVMLFSTYGFPLIPQQYGGGAPSKIRLIPSHSAKDEPTILKMDAKLKDRSQPYQLIFEDAATYVLSDPENAGLILRVKKTLFIGYELLDARHPQKSRFEILEEEHNPRPSETVSPIFMATPATKTESLAEPSPRN
jgi:hypothetical protein